MKATKIVIAAALTGLFSFSSLAATQVSSTEGLTKLGSVSASGPTTLSGLEKKLAKKADEAGATSYKIVSAGGENKLHGVAIIYN
ncbi:multiple stress resistance protein BhsA [Rahnella sp. PCH160]|uniref:multiple stress resistance protein BhsA n=1 Tax=Rahnella sp. PCH160 TaxID=3447928 RepID=UPI0039FBA360